MNKVEALLRKGKIAVPTDKIGRATQLKTLRAMTMQAEAMRLGFIFDAQAIEAISLMKSADAATFYTETLTSLRSLVGADVNYAPMYPNFPRQVMEASDSTLFWNAVRHYWSYGEWIPSYAKDPRYPQYENTNFRLITLAEGKGLLETLTEILGANASVTPADRKTLVAVFDDFSPEEIKAALPEKIPFKETLCWFVGECLTRGLTTVGLSALKTPTDLLRVVTHLSGGDVSLATNTKFRSFKRPARRAIMTRLEEIVNPEDIFRHRGKWIRLAHSLHAGEYGKIAPKAVTILRQARSQNFRFRSFDSKVNTAFEAKDRAALSDLLKTRPGVFARKLDHLIRTFGSRGITSEFLKVAEKVDTRVLLQLYGHFNARTGVVDRRVVFPKGGKGSSRILDNRLPGIPAGTINTLRKGISDELIRRFSGLETLGKVFIENSLEGCPIPLALRDASDSLVTVARGTQIPLDTDKDTLRMFIYWVGRDIDLSGFFVNEDFTKQDTVSYYNLRGRGSRGDIFSHHSGDIVDGRAGAAEFIDVNIPKAIAQGHRYLVMSVLVYSGPSFNEHETCYAGWMTRSHPNSNEVFDPKTVNQKMDLTSESKNAIPVMFDLVERKAIWLDLSTSRGTSLMRPNNVASNKASMYDAVTAAISLDNKPTLHDLFYMHAKGRGTIVNAISKADTVFSWDEGIKPTDTTRILSEFLQ